MPWVQDELPLEWPEPGLTARPICPECEQGKHGNCDGLTWDDIKDDYTYCTCSSDRHTRCS